ncbi:ferritin-like domain-containing protein [Pseudomonas sp. NPDC087336]|uniref:ferritin-like domain-containing protein n=1 Tax=Pseudomonas sp. NPDC087336 TaxID=3364436 RepID=UPI00381FC840
MTSSDPKQFKLYPRNLTAHADIVVAGNPVTSRTESGVENCFPGLEFDQRNLDKRFFPGLVFEMHHASGIILREFDADGPAGGLIEPHEIGQGVFLAYIQGMFTSRTAGATPRPRIIPFMPPAGLDSWRFVRDLEPGQVGVLLCDENAFSQIGSGAISFDNVELLFKDRRNRPVNVPNGKIVMLFGERTRYLDSEGVIAPSAAATGELTQSLCSPWQYDFADCGCFYWASNKPDLVSNEAQPESLLNFQRRNRTPESDAAVKAEDWLLSHGRQWDGDALIMRHVETMMHWEALPFVMARSETDRYVPTPQQPAKKPLSRSEIVDRLRKLASVEHALAVEYLYAHYSFGLPSTKPVGATPDQARSFRAASEIFQVAVDEMRHLRAVNEMLISLGEEHVLERARIIGEDFDGPGTGFKHNFVLRPCTSDHLDWFMEVERASQSNGEADQSTIDGMYTLILYSVETSNDFTHAEKQRLSHLVKIIIDEGIDHYKRFGVAKEALSGLSPAQYLKVPDKRPKAKPIGTSDRALQDVVDAAYLVLLRSLDYVFQLDDQQRGALLESARRAMYNMDDAARSLAARGIGALFDYKRVGSVRTPVAGAGMPVAGIVHGALTEALDPVDQLGIPLITALDALDAAESGANDLARRMRDRLDTMQREFRTVTESRG